MKASSAAYELIRPNSAGVADRGIDCLLAGPEGQERPGNHELRQRQGLFRDYCRENNLDLKCQRVAMADGHIIATCLWVPNKGKTALFYLPDLHRYPDAIPAAQQCLCGALKDAAADGVVLAQCLLETDNLLAVEAYQSAGFLNLAVLLYMDRGKPFFAPRTTIPSEVELFTYTPDRHELFAQAIAASYIDTLDCPALSGLRSINDVIAGHMAVGRFDPSLWLLAVHHEQPIGVLLMAHQVQRDCLEIVYLGLAPEARRKGLGTAFMHMALRLMMQRGAAASILAVDEKNTPAQALYRRMHYRQTGARRVLYKRL
jgi:mycothiol synthase